MTSRAVAAVPPEPVLRWTMLLHDVGKPPCFTVDDRGVGHFYGHPKVSAELAETACRRLRMDKRTAHQVVTLVQWHDRDHPRTEKPRTRRPPTGGGHVPTAAGGKAGRSKPAQHPDYRYRLADIDRAEEILNTLLEKQACFSLRDLAVNGRDLTALGLRGPPSGKR